jgi:hypothetical protein
MDTLEQVLTVPLAAMMAGILVVTALWLYGARRWRGVPVEHRLAPHAAGKAVGSSRARLRA